jgi:hypothetical protein
MTYLANDHIYRNTLVYLSEAPELAFFYTRTTTKLINDPRYNLIATCQTALIKKLCVQYREQKIDTTLSRMLISAPPAPMCSAQEIREASKEDNVEISAIFFFIDKMHKIKRTYTFSEEALEIFEIYFDKYRHQCEKLLEKDTYLA